MGLGATDALPSRSADGPLSGRHPGTRQRRAPEHRRSRTRRLAARDRDHRAPGQQRRGARRERQRLGHRRADRARARVRARVRHDAADASGPHARLRLHRRWRLRRPRRGSVRGALALPHRPAGRDQPRRDRRYRPAAAAHRRRHGPFTGRRARTHGRGSRPRAVRSRAGALVRHPPAARPRLSVHLRRAGAVCRPRQPGTDAHHRSGSSRRRFSRTTRSVPRAWASSAGRPRTSSGRSTPASSSRRERRATCTSERDSCGAGRSSSCS